jgi:hypothetical protein
MTLETDLKGMLDKNSGSASVAPVAEEKAPSPVQSNTPPEPAKAAPAPAADSAVSTDYEKQIEAFKKAAIEERRKRQAAELEAAEWKGRAAAAGEKPAAPQEPQALSDEFWLNPIEFIDKKAEEKFQAKMEAAWQKRADRSEKRAFKKYEDYSDLRAEFLELCKTEPQLFAEMREEDDPAEFLVQTMKERATPKKSPEILALEKQIEEYKAQLEEKQQTNNPPKKAKDTLASHNSPPVGSDPAPSLKNPKQLLKAASAPGY